MSNNHPRNTGFIESTKRKRVFRLVLFREKNPRFCCGRSGSFKQDTKRRQTESIKDPATSSNLSTHTTKPHANTYYLTDTIKLLLTDKFKKEQQTVRHNL